MIYPGDRRFLRKDDDLRKDQHRFPNKAPDLTAPPEIKTVAYVDKAIADYNAAVTKQDKTRVAQVTGCKGSYSLRRLPSHEWILNTPIDPMHLVKNIAEHCVKLIVG